MGKKETKSPKTISAVKDEKPVVAGVVSKQSTSRKKLLVGLALAIVLIGAAAGGGVLYQAYLNQKERADRLTNPAEAAKEETRMLIDKVGTLTELPPEEPTIATVRDISKLQDQPFFKNAQNGDKVLIFTQAKKAVLYRPSSEKIIEIAPLNLGDTPASTGTSTTPTDKK